MNIDFQTAELDELKARGVSMGIQSVVVEHRTFLATPDGRPVSLRPAVSVIMQPGFSEEKSEVESWKVAYLAALQELFFSGGGRDV